MLLGGVAWIGSHELDPAKPLDGTRQAARCPGRLARLEMAVHLPRPGHRERQPARRSGRRAGAFRADLGERDERVLHPAARQHDLHDERHDDAAEPARRRARHLPGLSAHFSGDGFSGHAFRRAGGAAGRIRRLGRRRTRNSGADARRSRATRHWPSRVRKWHRSPTARSIPTCSSRSSTQTHAARARAGVDEPTRAHPRSGGA